MFWIYKYIIFGVIVDGIYYQDQDDTSERYGVNFLRFQKALKVVEITSSYTIGKHSLADLYIAYENLQKKRPFSFDTISNVINATLQGNFTADRKRLLSKAIQMGDLYSFFNKFEEINNFGQEELAKDVAHLKTNSSADLDIKLAVC